MSKFKATFTLKQHTPLIHFQANQSGATLRATELKPKFDRFLKEYAFGGSVPDKYKIKKDKDALDYKIKIESTPTKKEPPKNRIYFGNMGKNPYEEEYRYTIKSLQPFKIEFISFKSDLLQTIKEFFPVFLARNNFGTRQNKGYGSYYIDIRDKSYMSPIEALDKIKSDYIYIQYNQIGSQKVFEHVEIIYPLIKSGINFPDHPKNDRGKPDFNAGRGPRASYYKSYLFQYMLSKKPPIGNEKKFIKENFFRNVHDEYSRNDNQTKKYVRALLGIGDVIEFRGKRRGKIEISSNQIDRFKSPLTFKIIDNTLIIIAEKINPYIFNKQFNFSNTFRSRNGKVTVNRNILTPKSNEFDLEDFLYSFADYFNELTPSNKNPFDKKIQEAKKSNFKKARQ